MRWSRSWLGATSLGHPSSMTRPSCARLRSRLQFFVRAALPSETTGGVAVITGHQALKHKLEPLWTAHTEGAEPPSMTSLDEFHLFKFLLEPSEVEQVDTLTEVAVAAAKAAAPSSSSGPKKRARPAVDSGKGKPSKKAKAQAMADSMDLFA